MVRVVGEVPFRSGNVELRLRKSQIVLGMVVMQMGVDDQIHVTASPAQLGESGVDHLTRGDRVRALP